MTRRSSSPPIPADHLVHRAGGRSYSNVPPRSSHPRSTRHSRNTATGWRCSRPGRSSRRRSSRNTSSRSIARRPAPETVCERAWGASRAASTSGRKAGRASSAARRLRNRGMGPRCAGGDRSRPRRAERVAVGRVPSRGEPGSMTPGTLRSWTRARRRTSRGYSGQRFSRLLQRTLLGGTESRRVPSPKRPRRFLEVRDAGRRHRAGAA